MFSRPFTQHVTWCTSLKNFLLRLKLKDERQNLLADDLRIKSTWQWNKLRCFALKKKKKKATRRCCCEVVYCHICTYLMHKHTHTHTSSRRIWHINSLQIRDTRINSQRSWQSEAIQGVCVCVCVCVCVYETVRMATVYVSTFNLQHFRALGLQVRADSIADDDWVQLQLCVMNSYISQTKSVTAISYDKVTDF